MKNKLLPHLAITALALAASAFTVHACGLALAERFGLRHFPTVTALKPDGTAYARHTYTDETAADMAG